MEKISNAVKEYLRKNPDAALQEIMEYLREQGFNSDEINEHFDLNKSAKPPKSRDEELESYSPDLDDIWDLPDDVKNDLDQ
jgi:hypothetical protein